MLTNIKNIKKIRSFIDFSSKGIDLKKKNIIYSPNGIGKTNLSRIFDYLKSDKKNINELKSQEAGTFDKIEFTFSFDGKEINQDNFCTDDSKEILNNILIFNSDYVEKNIRCENFSEKDVSGEIQIPLGKEGSEISLLEKSIFDDKKDRINVYKLIEKSFIGVKDENIKNQTYKASDKKIWEAFSINKLIDNSTYLITKPEDEEEFKTCEKDFVEISNLDDDHKINFDIQKINISGVNFSEIQEDLKTPKKFLVSDEETKNNVLYLTKEWIEVDLLQKGIIKSKEKDKCLLCKRKLDDSVNELFEKYEIYFKNEEVKFKKQISFYRTQVEVVKALLFKINNNLKTQTEELAKLLGIKESWIDFDTVVLLGKTEELINFLIEKENNPSREFKIKSEENNENIDEYNFLNAITSINQNIERNEKNIIIINDKLTKTSGRKTQLRSIIGKKLLYNIYNDNKHELKKITEYSQTIKDSSKKLKIERENLPKKSVSKNIEELCNHFLNDFLCIKKYSIEEDNSVLFLKLELKDISSQTNKISEGEKNMIALCYFLASSIQYLNSSEKFLKATFIIDDPVCSTSYNYFFGMCNLIKFFEEEIFKKLWKNDFNKIQQSNLQKIILTHNTPFFNMMRSHVFKDPTKNYTSKIGYLQLSNSGITEIGENQLKSEFEMAIYNIKKASESSSSDINIGNDLRRFFETIRHFYGYKEFNAESLKKIFDKFDNLSHNTFFSVVNYYSHGNPEAHNDPLPTNFKPFIEQFDEIIRESQFKELWDIDIN